MTETLSCKNSKELPLWDAKGELFLNAGCIYHWDGYTEKDSAHSLLRYVETHSERLRHRYLAWIHDLDESQINGKHLIEHLALSRAERFQQTLGRFQLSLRHQIKHSRAANVSQYTGVSVARRLLKPSATRPDIRLRPIYVLPNHEIYLAKQGGVPSQEFFKSGVALHISTRDL